MRSRLAGLLLVGGMGVFGGAAASGAPEETKPGRELHYLDHMDESLPLREVRPIPPNWDLEKWEHPVGRLPHAHGTIDLASQRDAAVQLAPTPLVGTTPGLNFDGVGVGLGSFTPSGAPPDTNGAVGATQYVQWVNTSLAVFNKTTGALVYGPAAGNTLWQGFGGPCEANNNGDPIALYDKAAGRWVMTQFSVTGGQFLQCVAVSTTSDATGSYRRFSFTFSNFNDYPKVGVWPDGYYFSFNMFNPSLTSFLGARACVVDRNQMITATGTPAPMQCFQLSSAYGGLLPSDLDGSTPPPPGSPNYYLAFDGAGLNALNLWKLHVDWATPANSSFTGPTRIPVAAFAEACGGGTCIPQPGTTQQLDSLADRLMYRLAYRNFGDHESLVVNHSVNVSGSAGLRWYEVRSPGAMPTLYQQGTWAPDASYRWLGSIAMDRAGNMLVGYSVSSSTVRPSIRYTGRLAGDALGTMQGETEMFTGTGSQLRSLSRWGDYSAMTVDPTDDCTFWFTTEDLKTSGTFNWSTRIASFKFPSCGAAATPDFSISVSPASLAVTQGASGASTVAVTSLNGFNSATTLSASGLPAGVAASFSANPVTPPAGGGAGSTLTLIASSSAATGTSTVTVTGTSGSLAHSTSLSLTVNSANGSFRDTLLALAQQNQLIQFNTGAALQKAIFAANFAPNSGEFRFGYGGINYVAQRAEHLGSGEVRAYYVVDGDWGNVRYERR